MNVKEPLKSTKSHFEGVVRWLYCTDFLLANALKGDF